MSDLISRDDAKKIIDNIDTFCAGWRDYAKEQIDNLSTAEKVGKWIEVENEWGGLEIICSECGVEIPRDAWGNAMQSAYCYRCGARMRGEEDE